MVIYTPGCAVRVTLIPVNALFVYWFPISNNNQSLSKHFDTELVKESPFSLDIKNDLSRLSMTGRR